MSTNYGVHLTVTGEAKRTNAEITGNKLKITEVAFGDGDGPPLRTRTGLQNEVWRGAINSIDPHASDPNIAVIECVLPSNVGGFYVREIGFFDSAGDMVAVGNVAESYQPEPIEGQVNDQFFEVNLIVSGAAQVTLSLDPSVTQASRSWVMQQIEPLHYALAVEIVEGLRSRLSADLAARSLRKDLASIPQNADQSTGTALTQNTETTIVTSIYHNSGSSYAYLKDAFHPVFFSATARPIQPNSANPTSGFANLMPFQPLADMSADALRYWHYSGDMGFCWAAIYDRAGNFLGGATDNHTGTPEKKHGVIEFAAVELKANELYYIGFYHNAGEVVTASYENSGQMGDNVLPNVFFLPELLEVDDTPNTTGLTSTQPLILRGAVTHGNSAEPPYLTARSFGPILTLRNAA